MVFYYSENSTVGTIGRRARLPTEPGPDTTSLILSSPTKSPPYNNTGTDSDDSSYKCKKHDLLRLEILLRFVLFVIKKQYHISHVFKGIKLSLDSY